MKSKQSAKTGIQTVALWDREKPVYETRFYSKTQGANFLHDADVSEKEDLYTGWWTVALLEAAPHWLEEGQYI